MRKFEYNQPAISTAVYYFIFGFLWILLSDRILHHLSPDIQFEQQFQTYKGWLFIAITTVLIYYIVKQKLESSANRYRQLFETNPVPLIVFDLVDHTFYDVNQAAEKLLGYPGDEFLLLNIRDIRPDLGLYTDKELKVQLVKELSQTLEVVLVKKSRAAIQVEIKSDQIDFEGKMAVLLALNDITALREAEKKVLQSIIEGEDNERRRVSKELHDSLGQNLTAASLNFNTINESIEKLGGNCLEKFETGMSFLKIAIEESRNIAHNLMPKAIEDFGLIPSLNSLFEKIQSSTGISIHLYETLNERRLNKQVELNLFRITQEAINNVIRHANANEIFIQLIKHKNEIIYTFEDNGQGFDTNAIKPGERGMGLKNIFNRVKTMSGRAEIDSRLGKGTSLTIEIPI
nr:PAS domain-containing sensor histidine kinase [Bacteroidota bacterium]